MQIVLSRVLNISKDQINIKATTTEGLGFAGRQEGIAAYAVALLVGTT
jgi:2-C-methyl-D-erythritol 2,4-cyclodiphosphate synthase